MMPAGVRRYGKVITKNDKDLEPGYNLVEKTAPGSSWTRTATTVRQGR